MKRKLSWHFWMVCSVIIAIAIVLVIYFDRKDPKRQYIVRASEFRADEGIGPYDADFYVVSVEPAYIAD